MKIDDNSDEWLTIVNLVEGYIRENGESGILEEMVEFRQIRRLDQKAVIDRANIIRSGRDAKKIDRELGAAKPEREKLSERDQALEMISALAKMVVEIPEMIIRAERSLSEGVYSQSGIRIEWREESQSGSMQSDLLDSVRSDDFSPAIRAAQEVLAIIEAGEKEGWQI